MFPIIAFALGVWLCQMQAQLTGPLACVLILALPACLFGAVRIRFPRCRPACIVLCALAAGFSYADLRAGLRLADGLDPVLEGRDLIVTGHIAGLPHSQGDVQSFDFIVAPGVQGVPHRLSLAWYARPAPGAAAQALPVLHGGERWQLSVRLVRPHGSMNPAGFDYEAWLFQRGVRATGYVTNGDAARRLAPAEGLLPVIDRLREAVRERIVRALPGSDTAGVLAALAVGDQGAVSREQWQVFARTGTSHLMAISGLHVSLVAVLVSWLMQFLWRRMERAALYLPAQKAGACAGLAAAICYTALAGFGVPAQRTLYMLAVVALAQLTGRARESMRCLAWALLVVLLIDPWAVLAAGFWLSFGAVGALMLVSSGRFSRAAGVRGWLRAQGAVMLSSLPLVLGLFGQFSLVSPLANAVAIPAVSMLITPLVLLFVVLPIAPILQLANFAMHLVMLFLALLADTPMAVWQQASPPGWLIVLALAAALWALLPRGLPGRWAGLLVIVVLVSWSPPRPREGAWRVTTIDVGQGLAVHVQTARHDLLFDTGPRYGENTDSGERIVVPYLRGQGVGRLDALMLSHGDMDHAGGAASVFGALPVDWWASSVPATNPLRERPNRFFACQRGLAWQWDGIRFDVLNPATAESDAGKTNGRSCVLRVRGAWGTALLPADIEASSELEILSAVGGQLHADLLIAPHHGSRTSSRVEFIDAVSPRLVVFPVGHRNRFRHPAPSVVARYQHAGAALARTDEDGAVRVDMDAYGMTVTRWRDERARYWRGR